MPSAGSFADGQNPFFVIKFKNEEEKSMKKVFLTFVLFAFVGVAANVSANSGPVEVKFEAKNGTVTYMHAQHTKYGAECGSCHHQGVLSGTCRRCHDGKGKAPIFKQAAHKLCKDCHKKNSGPTECRGCHIK